LSGHELYADPKWFFCERRAQEVRLGRCIGMQKANTEKEHPDTPDPYPVCMGCTQGTRNRLFEENWTEGSPKRGKGQRDVECRLYAACLNIAVERDWRSWNCGSCPYYESGHEQTITAMENQENTRLCEECHEKPTFGMSPFCASCMAIRSNKARSNKERKGKNTKKTKPQRARKREGHSKDKPEKSPPRGDTAVLKIDFGRKYAPILMQIERLADQEVRSVESQVIYMLKTSLSKLGETAQLTGS
jgi:hypothetical protein